MELLRGLGVAEAHSQGRCRCLSQPGGRQGPRSRPCARLPLPQAHVRQSTVTWKSYKEAETWLAGTLMQYGEPKKNAARRSVDQSPVRPRETSPSSSPRRPAAPSEVSRHSCGSERTVRRPRGRRQGHPRELREENRRHLQTRESPRERERPTRLCGNRGGGSARVAPGDPHAVGPGPVPADARTETCLCASALRAQVRVLVRVIICVLLHVLIRVHLCVLVRVLLRVFVWSSVCSSACSSV